MKRFHQIARVFAVLFALALPCYAVVIVDDTWADGSRLNTPITTSSTIWYASSSTSLIERTGSLLGTNLSTSRMWVGYFTDNAASPVDLAVGETLKVSLVFTPVNVAGWSGSGTVRSLRFGLLNYADGGTRLPADTFSTGGGNGANVTGYMLNQSFYTNFSVDTPLEIRVRSNLGSANLLGTSGDFTGLGSGPVGLLDAPGFFSGISYTLEFSITRTATDSVDVTTRIFGGSLDISFTASDNSVYATHRFDSFAIRPTSAAATAESFTFTEFKVEVLGAGPPVITAQPQNQAVLEGGTAIFNVTAIGTEPLSYQWMFNGTNLVGRTNATLTLTSVTTNDVGSYSVLVSNEVDSVLSSNATLTLRTSADCGFQPSYVASITFRDALPSSTVMTMAFDGTNYWASSGGNASGTHLGHYNASGAFLGGFAPGLDFRSVFTDPTGAVFARQYGDATIYRQVSAGAFVPSGVALSGGSLDAQAAVVFNGAGTELITQSGGTVTRWSLNGTFLGTVNLSGFGSLPGESSYPANRGIAGVGEFWLTYNGLGALSAWDASGQRVAQATLVGAGTSFESAFSFSYCNGRVFIVDSPGGFWRGYEICASGSNPPVIFQQPASQTLAEGVTAQFNVAVVGSYPFSYQWRFNGTDLSGETNNSLTLAAATTNQSGGYSVVITNAYGAVTSSVAVLNVIHVTPPKEFQIASLTANNSHVVDHDALTGDDRGGIAASTTKLFYSGDYSTARFSLTDLSGGTSLGVIYDALASDLESGRVYSFANDFGVLTSGGGVATRLIEHDGTTGALTGNEITLSTPVTMGYGSGIFAGYGRIVVHNGNNAYDIRLPSGLVIDLGAMSSFTHQGAESWAYWGVAEYFGGVVYLTYVQGYQTIARTAVPSGVTATVATFNNLSDMASFTVSVPFNRWYFHHEGASQFGGLYETLGYADAFVLVGSTNPPVIAVQPKNRNVAEGVTAQFNVAAAGSQPLSYQWRFNNANLPGETNNSLTLAATTTNQSGGYSVVITNAYGAITSSVAVLNVIHVTPPEEFQIAVLATNNSHVVDDSALTGSYGGGIAASATKVFYSGQSYSAGFSLTDLSGGTALATAYRSWASDLQSGKIYSLADDFGPLNYWGGTATRLLEHDGTTGALTGNEITLSDPISLYGYGGVGIFSGYGRIVVHNGSNAYDIRVPSGAVINLGAVYIPSHQSYYYSLGYWGVAEYFGGTVYVTYVQDYRTIVRTAVPSGVTTTVATFNSLGDMSNFTVSVPFNRWYFHYNSPGQFGGATYGTLGYADAFVLVGSTNPPVIAVQPKNRNVAEGVTAQFNVAAAGSQPLSYQWRFNNANLPGETNNSLTLAATTTNQSGGYSVVITNAYGAITSSVAVLNVIHVTPPEEFQIAVLATNNSHVVDDSALTGSYGGGIAASATKVFYSGQSYSAGFSLTDLSGGTALATAYRSWASDLQSGKIYSLADDFGPLNYWGGTATRLLEHDGTTGALTGNEITLSDPISLYGYGGVGIFSGYGRIVVHNGSNAYDIRVPSGAVINLGAVYIPSHQSYYYSLGYWGVAEYFGGTVYVTYVQDYRTIVRTAVPSGVTTTVATFNSLGDMSNFTVSVPFNRWYFHYNSPGQFGGATYGTLGYADAFVLVGSTNPPVIAVQPKNRNVAEGVTAQFNVAAVGSQPFSYQWRFNNANLSGETNDTLMLTAVTTDDSGNYRVVVANAFGSVTSSVAMLNVIPVAPPNDFQILSLTANNSRVVDHNALTGDDRGGIAASVTQLFYSGDNSTARFSLTDLSGGTSLGVVYDALASDLESGQVYSFANDFGVLTSGGGTATRLIEHDGTTGALTGNEITLSTPITMFSGSGIFAGYGRIVVHNGNNAYDIRLPSGLVIDLGAMSSFAHQSTENWAYWGVAEYFGGTVYLTYVRDNRAIVRTAVPSGVTSTVNNFFNLADMACITVSIPFNRWYFHHEGNSGFGGQFETVGYADATFSILSTNRPYIISQPQSQNTTEGSPIQFSVLVTGARPLSYQWRFNGSNLPGATNATLSLTGVTTNESGSYSVVVSNAYGFATSAAATLTVMLLPPCTLDWNEVRQRIDGFGGGVQFLSPGSLDPVPNSVMDTLFLRTNANQLGLTLLRIGIDPVNWNNDQLLDAQKAVVRGAGILASPWTPPAYMKNNSSRIGGSLLPAHYTNYANYLNNFAGFMASNNAPVKVVSIQNEPDWDASYDSCVWTSPQLLTFCRDVAGLITNALVMMPESLNFNQSMSEPTLNNAVAAANVDIIGGHLYGNGDAGAAIVDYPNAHNRGKPTWMTEFLVNDQTIGTAITTAKQIHDCLTVGNMSAYIWWKAYGDANGVVNASGVPQKRGFVLGQYSRFVRPGYYRIGATNSGVVMVSAYRDTNSGSFAIVAINPASNSVNQSFSLTNFTAGLVTPWITSGTMSLSNQPAIVTSGSSFSYTLPPMSVVTFVGYTLPTITIQPESQAVMVGEDVNFTVTATGTPPLAYQWRFNGNNLLGQTNNALLLGAGNTNLSGQYSVVITNTYGAVTSVVATLTVTPPPSSPPNFDLVGFATVNGTTTGGQGGSIVTASNVADFMGYVGASDPLIVLVHGSINLGGGNVQVASHKTIIGVGNDATLIGDLRMSSVSNIIVRNLHFTNPNGAGEGDGITLKTNATHVWIDHCSFHDCGDGELDVSQSSDYITVSWCKFYYTFNSGHNFVNLIGADDSQTADRGKLNVTFHHNWWSTLCVERMPRVRRGHVHTFNNFYNSPSNNYCIRAALESQLLIENNFFKDVNSPWEVFITISTNGMIRATNNILVRCTNTNTPANDPVFTPPYPYTPDPAVDVPFYAINYAGGGRLPPIILAQPQSQIMAAGSNVTLSVATVGAIPMNYQWRCNGTNVAGAAGPSLTITNIQEASQGVYSVVVSNSFGVTTSGDVTITVNQPPVADASATSKTVISANGANATLVLNGSLSFDPDGDFISYSWYEGGVPLADGVVAVRALPTGTHSIVLVVSDGMLAGANTVTVKIVTVAQAIEELIRSVRSNLEKPQSLIAILNAALDSLNRGNTISAVNQLLAFQNKVRAQVIGQNPALGASLIQAAQDIINVLTGGHTNPGGRPHAGFNSLSRQSNGRMQIRFSAGTGGLYIIEASTNLLDWQTIGVATVQADGSFLFEDPQAVSLPRRFYRVVELQ